jgi:cobalamin-dependent methionine synthase I
MNISKEQWGGLIVIVGCSLLVVAAGLAWGLVGVIVAIAILLIAYGVGMVLVAQDNQRKAEFEKKREEIKRRFAE